MCLEPGFADERQNAPADRDATMQSLIADIWKHANVNVEVDGKQLSDHWDETLERLFAFTDRNRNGSLDPSEADRLPAPYFLRQPLWGRFEPWASDLPFHELDHDGNSCVDRPELAAFYRHNGLGNAQVVLNEAMHTQALTDALAQRVDPQHDGSITGDDLQSLLRDWKSIDLNEDSLMTPGELLPGITYPATTGNQLVIPRILDAPRDTPTGFRWQAELRSGSLKQTHFQIEPGDGAHPTLSLRAVAVASDVPARWERERMRFEALFRDTDLDRNGSLEDRELTRPSAAPLRDLRRIADQDNNQQISEAEMQTWVTFQTQLLGGLVQFTITDFGSGLYETLDANGDGAISKREILAASQEVERRGVPLRLDSISRHVLVTASVGMPSHPLAVNVDDTLPVWFRRSDANRDGWLSRTEFLGSSAGFERWDSNRDDYLTVDEVLEHSAER